MKAITITGALLAIGLAAAAPALAQDGSGQMGTQSGTQAGTAADTQTGAMAGNGMAMAPSDSMPKMSKSQMAAMKKCQAMSSDMMMKNRKCAAMAKMHPEMMQGGTMNSGT